MRALASSPSSGEFELLRVLYLARGHNGHYVKVDRLKRWLYPRTPTSQVTALLSGASSTYVQTDGSGGYRLTAAGVARSRAHKPRRWVFIP